MSETQTTPAPAQPVPEQQAPEPAPPGQRSTGGDLTNGRPAPRPIDRAGAQDVLRQAYARALREPGQQQAQADEQAREAPPLPATPAKEAPAKEAREAAPRPAVERVAGRERGADGRFLPQQPEQVDEPAPDQVQETQQPAPPARAPRPAPQAQARRAQPEAPEAPAATEPAPAPEPEAAPAQDFASQHWQRAFQAQPGLRRTVGGIRNDPKLSTVQKADLLSEKLTAALRVADALDYRQQQMDWLRDNRPQDFINQIRADQQSQQAQKDLEQRISAMIAEAYEIPADDPEFQNAGAGPDEDYATGLAKFVDVTARRSPVVRRHMETALAAQAEQHQQEIAALRAQHKLDVEAALERGRAQGRGGRGSGMPQPRATGTGVRPVGQQDGPGGGPPVPRRAPDVATYRGAFALGYQQREPV